MLSGTVQSTSVPIPIQPTHAWTSFTVDFRSIWRPDAQCQLSRRATTCPAVELRALRKRLFQPPIPIRHLPNLRPRRLHLPHVSARPAKRQQWQLGTVLRPQARQDNHLRGSLRTSRVRGAIHLCTLDTTPAPSVPRTASPAIQPTPCFPTAACPERQRPVRPILPRRTLFRRPAPTSVPERPPA